MEQFPNNNPESINQESAADGSNDFEPFDKEKAQQLHDEYAQKHNYDKDLGSEIRDIERTPTTIVRETSQIKNPIAKDIATMLIPSILANNGHEKNNADDNIISAIEIILDFDKQKGIDNLDEYLNNRYSQCRNISRKYEIWNDLHEYGEIRDARNRGYGDYGFSEEEYEKNEDAYDYYYQIDEYKDAEREQIIISNLQRLEEDVKFIANYNERYFPNEFRKFCKENKINGFNVSNRPNHEQTKLVEIAEHILEEDINQYNFSEGKDDQHYRFAIMQIEALGKYYDGISFQDQIKDLEDSGLAEKIDDVDKYIDNIGSYYDEGVTRDYPEGYQEEYAYEYYTSEYGYPILNVNFNKTAPYLATTMAKSEFERAIKDDTSRYEACTNNLVKGQRILDNFKNNSEV